MINSENDIRLVINYIRYMCHELDFTEVDTQKIMVAVSELTQNILDHTDRPGFFICDNIDNKGIIITVKDNGKGIENVENIIKGEKVIHKKGLGLGLAGAKRLLDDFKIETTERGTTIIGTKWRNY